MESPVTDRDPATAATGTESTPAGSATGRRAARDSTAGGDDR
jgi:hypothetical protein